MQPCAGTSAEYLHPSASGGSHGASAADVFNASSLPLVHVSDDRVSAGPSNLSRVSLSIMKELSNAEWRIDPKSLVLGQMIGKGGFGRPLLETHFLSMFFFYSQLYNKFPWKNLERSRSNDTSRVICNYT